MSCVSEDLKIFFFEIGLWIRSRAVIVFLVTARKNDIVIIIIGRIRVRAFNVIEN
jgi:hypothetical protein